MKQYDLIVMCSAVRPLIYTAVTVRTMLGAKLVIKHQCAFTFCHEISSKPCFHEYSKDFLKVNKTAQK